MATYRYERQIVETSTRHKEKFLVLQNSPVRILYSARMIRKYGYVYLNKNLVIDIYYN